MSDIELSISIKPDGDAGNITVTHPMLPGEEFDFRTTEGVLSGNKDFGLFLITLAESDWRVGEKMLGYSWTYSEGPSVDFEARVQGDELALRYTVSNHSEFILERVQIHPCITTFGAPSFQPVPDNYKEGQQPAYFDRRHDRDIPVKNSYFELYDRLTLWSGSKAFSFSDSCCGRKELHLSFMRQEESPVEWAWWNNAPETFDLPLIVLASKGGAFNVGLGFEQAIWSSSNVGDERACFHMFPYFGDIPAQESRTVAGRFYFTGEGPEGIRNRFTAFLES